MNDKTLKSWVRGVFDARWLVVILLYLTQSTVAFAQQSITGTVTAEEDGLPLAGVTIHIKGTSKGTTTNLDGLYSIAAEEGSVLVYSFIGFANHEVTIGSQTVIDIALQTDVLLLDEAVVVGYGSLKRSDMTGAVTSIRGEQIAEVPLADPVQALQGRVAGMQILNASGDPGAAPIIRLRGVTTLNNNNPLFVVDGVIIDLAQEGSGSSLDFINPNDIASVEVLKDASATAIFGARGSNGVILITTKRGEKGEAQISLNAEQGWESISNKIALMNAREFATYVNDISPGTYNNLDALQDVDWQDEIFQDNAAIQNYSVSIRGGNDAVSYYTSLGYYSQEGILAKSSLERITGNVSIDYQIRDNLKMGINLNVAHYDKQNAPNVITTAYRAWPTDPATDASGNFQEVMGGGNALAAIEYSNSFRENIRTLGNAYLEYEVIDGLKFKSSIQFDGDFRQEKSFVPEFFVAPLQQNETSDINNEFNVTTQWVWENTVSYDQEWNLHRINAVVGYTAQERNYENIKGHTENLLRDTELFWYLDGGEVNGDERTVENKGNHSAILSMLFRFNYVYADKYLFTVTGRRDASSNFGRNNRAGFFPSVAAGWNIHEEEFYTVGNVINQLKLRGSWGIVGNEKIDFRDQYATVGSGIDAVFNDQLASGATFNSPGNPELKWESTEQYNIGLQWAALEARLSGEVDYYVKNSSDILVNLDPLGYAGYGTFTQIRVNAADVKNQGVEFSLSWEDEVGDFSYRIGANGSTVRNKVVGLGDIGADSVIVAGDLGNGQSVGRTIVGQPIGFFTGYEIVGVFQDTDQLANTPSLINQGVGDFIFNDRNNDGLITEADRIKLGSSIPDFIYGFSGEVSYKGWKLGMNFQGQWGNKIYNGKSTIRFAQLNYEKRFLNRWTPSNPTNEHPKASSGGPNFLPSGYYVEDGSFLRLRTLTLSYNLPTDLLENLRIGSAKVYLRGTNLLTFTDYSGYSPDLGAASPLDGVIDQGVYPQTRIYSVGMNLNF